MRAAEIPLSAKSPDRSPAGRLISGAGEHTIIFAVDKVFFGNGKSAMRAKDIVRAWVDAFNSADADALAAFYENNAINHQVAEEPVEGREAIREMFANGFARTEMVCIIENLFEDGEWAILEWRDPKGLRGCGFFHVVDSKIVFQRGYWDKFSFLKLHGLPAPKLPA